MLAAEGATEQDVADRIDEIWHHLDFGSAWYSTKQRALAERMVRKFLAWHAGNPRDLVAVEAQALKVRIGQVEITGRVDPLESDDQGRAVVVDLKTGGSAPREDELGRASAARRLPAGRAPRRLRAVRPGRAGRR